MLLLLGLFVLWTCLPMILIGGGGRVARAAGAACDAWRERRRPAQPIGPPIEELAVRIRRIAWQLDRWDRNVDTVRAPKWWGSLLAYDDVLTAACRALDLPTTLTDAPVHLRAAERERVVQQLDEAGFVLAPRWPARRA